MKSVFFILIILLIIPGSFVFSEIEPPGDVFSIQLGAFPGVGSANTRKAELQGMGFDPLKVVNDGYYNKILFGEFEYYLDAFIYLGMIKSDVEPNAFIEALPNTAQKNGEKSKSSIKTYSLR